MYPASIQARVQAISKEGIVKKNKWARKFKGHFMGKLTAKWKLKVNKATGIKNSVKDVMGKMGPVVYIKKKRRGNTRPRLKKAGPALGSKYKPRAKPSGASQLKREDRIEHHVDLKKAVMVTREAAGELLQGRRGTVTSVFKVIEADGRDWLKHNIIEDGPKASQFFADASFCEDISLVGTTSPASIQIDWRQLRGDRLESVINLLGARTAPANLELVLPGTLIEHSTVKAGLIELQERFQMANCKFYSPQECIMLGCFYIY